MLFRSSNAVNEFYFEKLEASLFSKIMVALYRNTRRHNPGVYNLNPPVHLTAIFCPLLFLSQNTLRSRFTVLTPQNPRRIRFSNSVESRA